MNFGKSFIIFSCLFIGCISFNPNINGSGGIAFTFSGAGGRLSQHLALMENLIFGLNPAGIKVRPNFISGASSGSISAVALNALLYSEDSGKNFFTWDDYKELVFNLQSSEVYDDSWKGLAKIFTYNIYEGYFLDSTPLQTYLTPFLAKMNFTTLGDLYLPTEISVVNQTSGDSIRLWSNDPQYADLDILEVIMASTAIPMAFTPRPISALGNDLFIDGGTGIDTLPVYGPLHDAKVDELYIICYGGAFTSGGALDLPPLLQDILLLKNAVAAIEDMRVDLFNGGVDIAAKSNVTSFLYMPNLNMTFSALDFDHEKLEYELSHEWSLSNNPLPLNSKKINLCGI